MDDLEEKIKKAIKKRALGFTVKETVKVYKVKKGKEELNKRKVKTKYYPPDLTAARVALENVKKIEEYSDGELTEERKRIEEELKIE
jgi:hypothetical protein